MQYIVHSLTPFFVTDPVVLLLMCAAFMSRGRSAANVRLTSWMTLAHSPRGMRRFPVFLHSSRFTPFFSRANFPFALLRGIFFHDGETIGCQRFGELVLIAREFTSIHIKVRTSTHQHASTRTTWSTCTTLYYAALRSALWHHTSYEALNT